jgi:hypothetical protein
MEIKHININRIEQADSRREYTLSRLFGTFLKIGPTKKWPKAQQIFNHLKSLTKEAGISLQVERVKEYSREDLRYNTTNKSL